MFHILFTFSFHTYETKNLFDAVPSNKQIGKTIELNSISKVYTKLYVEIRKTTFTATQAT